MNGLDKVFCSKIARFFAITALFSATANLNAQNTVTLAFIGDVMQHKMQLQAAHISGKDTLLSDSYDYSSYFSRLGDAISGADFAVANMEFPCGLPPYSGYPQFSAPTSLAAEAQKAGIDLFLCANNHIFDRGTAGAKSTISTYESLGMNFTGVYPDSLSQRENYPFMADVRGIKIAFINFTYGTNGNRASCLVNRMDSIAVKKAAAAARERGADIIIALPHWGEEYTLEPSAEQLQWQKMLYREGIRIIIGTHPHVIQSVDVSICADGAIDRLTAFSLGNYISNMSLKNTQVGMLFTVKLTKSAEGAVSIAASDAQWLWCARRGKLEKNYTTIPIAEYLDRKNDFIIKEEFLKMKRSYLHLQEIIKYGK